MAEIDDLVAHVEDESLRAMLLEAVTTLRRHRPFGLVFERHLPEAVILSGVRPRIGDHIFDRKNEGYPLSVIRETNSEYECEDEELRTHTVAAADALVVSGLGERVYPTLRHVKSINQGKPSHVLMRGENFHALQLLQFGFQRAFDCIYIDPPYNTGARDWKYNNRFVDKTDAWRHSKWLSFMEKRLLLAKELLRDDGVLVIAIDENEHAHLVLLLEHLFPTHDITSVAVIHNPRGIQGDNFSYVNDFAIFVTPKGREVISKRLVPEDERETSPLRNWGSESLRTDAANCFYPIYVRDGKIVGFGDVLAEPSEHPSGVNTRNEDGTISVWPIDRKGVERKWRYARQSVELIRSLLSVTGGDNAPFDIALTKADAPQKTVWSGPRYDANRWGTQIVTAFAGTKFPFPKSLFTVADIVVACTADRPNALILDFFGGSGTTVHATMLVNAQLGGQRRCFLVTNNDVAESEQRTFADEGVYRGEARFESAGIFESVTVPRVEAAITGRTKSGQVNVPQGKMFPRPPAEGFEESADVYAIEYITAIDVETGGIGRHLTTLSWLSSGRSGVPPTYHNEDGIIAANGYVESEEPGIAAALKVVQEEDGRCSWISLWTDVDVLVSEVQQRAPKSRVVQLPRDYVDAISAKTEMLS